MKFRTYNDGGVTQVFVTTSEKEQSVSQNDFTFNGFSNGIHPYHRRRINRIIEILQSKGVILNVAEVSTVYRMSKDADSGEITIDDMTLPKGFDKKSKDGNTYILFQDIEMGRGWACLIKNDEILSQDHRDNILDELEEGEFVRSFGIDYRIETVNDLAKFKNKLLKASGQ